VSNGIVWLDSVAILFLGSNDKPKLVGSMTPLFPTSAWVKLNNSLNSSSRRL
jgi:hypothetical protein